MDHASAFLEIVCTRGSEYIVKRFLYFLALSIILFRGGTICEKLVDGIKVNDYVKLFKNLK